MAERRGDFFVSFGVDNLGVPAWASGWVLQKIYGSVSNIAGTNPDALEFGGELGLTFGPRVTLQLPSFLGGQSFEGELSSLELTGTVSSEKASLGGAFEFAERGAQASARVVSQVAEGDRLGWVACKARRRGVSGAERTAELGGRLSLNT